MVVGTLFKLPFKPAKLTLVLSIALVMIGTGWLTTTLADAPGLNWVWALALAIAGISTFLAVGLDKVTVVVGPLCILAGFLCVLRQASRLPTNVEAPILFVAGGILLLIARAPFIPFPAWVVQDPSER